MDIDHRLSHEVTEPELRRYLRHASTLLASIDPDTPLVNERILILRRARHWLRAALLGVDQILRDAEAFPDGEVEDPLTPAVNVATIGSEP
jgi:hypothetical protein